MNVFEKIIERLEKETDCPNCSMYCADANMCGFDEMRKQAIEIVNQVASEVGDGWIPCSERLPEDDRDVLVVMSDGSMMVDFRTASSSGWFWSDNDDMPLAWHELPQPYQPKGEQL